MFVLIIKYFITMNMKPKDFIQKVLIEEIGEIHQKHTYISFAMIAIGIEFLGKCLNNSVDWNEYRKNGLDFKLAIDTLKSFKEFKERTKNFDIYSNLRNGFAHSFKPKGRLILSSGNGSEHLKVFEPRNINEQSKIVLKCEDFYINFKNACLEVISMNNFNNDRMDKYFLDTDYKHE